MSKSKNPIEQVAGNGLLDRRALLGRGVMLAGAMGAGAVGASHRSRRRAARGRRHGASRSAR